MTDRFLKAMPDIFKHEGGFVNIKEDKGQATNFGISLVFLKGLSLKNGDINEDGHIDWLDIKSLSKQEAQELYWDNFWRPLYDKLPEAMGIKVFDVAINAGHFRAHCLLQQSLNRLGGKVKVDGVVGTQTLNACLAVDTTKLLDAFCLEQKAFYEAIVARKPEQKRFINGWLTRAAWKPK